MASNDVPIFWAYLLISMGLVLFAGLMSGLTLGLMSLSLVDLEVLAVSGQPKDRKNAAKILPVVKNQHLLLCTLLLGNSLAMEALPIFLDSILPAWGSILISVTLILAFGEIIPQAMCSRYGLSIGAKMDVVVHLLVWAFFPITYPISKLLDWLLGKEHFALLRRAELRTFVGLRGNAERVGSCETTIITGALDLTQKTAKDAMTLIQHTLGLIMSKGHSRVPIYSGNPTNIIGLILVKNLITCRSEDATPIRKASIRRIPRVPEHLPLYEILNEFQEGNSHMAVVVKGMKDVKKTSERAIGRSNILGTRVHTQAEQKGSNSSPVLEIIAEASPVGTPNSNLRNDVQNQNEVQQLFKEWDKKSETVIDINVESLPNHKGEDEIIGIITMEDVIEELLQETDEYNNVHHKIRMNMLYSRRSSPRSSRATPHYNFQQ